MASFLWRSDDLRRLRTRQLVLQGSDGIYPPEDALLRFVDASGVVGAAGIFVDDSGNLFVSGSVDISGGLTVGGSADISGDLLVDGSGSFGGSVSVTNNLHVGGTTDLSGDLYVYGFISASGDVISNSGLSRLSTNNIGVGACAIFSNSANDLGPQFKSFKMRDGSGAVLAGDELGRINFFGLDTAGGSSYGPAAAKIEAFAIDNFTSSSKPAELRFATTRVGDISAAEHMILTSEGALQVKHTTFGGDYIEQNLVDPSDGQTRFMRDYMVGQNDDGFGGKAYRNHRYVYDASLNANVWGIVNDASAGNLGDIEFYQHASFGSGVTPDPNSAITIGGPNGRSMHLVNQNASSSNFMVTSKNPGSGNSGYAIDSQYFDGSLIFGANLLLNSDTSVDNGITGNVGIGTVSPQEKLDVSGTARVYDGDMNVTIKNNGITLENTGNPNTEVILSNTGGALPAALRFLSFGSDGRNYIQSGATLDASSNADLVVGNMLNTKTAMVIDTSNQRVTIGGDFTPTATLSVAGTFRMNILSPAPTDSNDSSGVLGQIGWSIDGTDHYLYVRVSDTNPKWKRVALSTWP